jgi:ribosomal protein L29
MENITRVADDSPDRCQATMKTGQCTGKKIPGSDYCKMHGGAKMEDQQKIAGLRNYQLTKFQARIQQLGDSSEIKSLRDEIAILRMIMEERLNQCKDTMDLIYQSGPISDLVLKIERVVTSCHKLELSSGSLLDKQAIMQFGTELVSLINEEIKDEILVSRISNKIFETISRTIAAEE